MNILEFHSEITTDEKKLIHLKINEPQFSLCHLLSKQFTIDITSDSDIIKGFERDWSNIPGKAEYLTRPINSKQCAIILYTCNELKIPVTISAGKTNLTGSATPMGGLILSIINMQQPKTVINQKCKTVTTSVGTILEDMRNEIIHLTKIEFKGALICSIFLFSGYNFQNFGLWLDSTPTTSAFITSVSVILVPIFLVFTGKQKISYKIWYSVILALIGLFMLLNPISTGFKIGDVITFGCAIFFAGHIIYQDESVKKEINIFRFFLVQIGIVCILSFLCSLIFEPKSLLNSMNPDFWSTILIQALLINGILATTIAIMIMVWAQKIVSASQTAIFFSLEPFFAALFSWYLINEQIGFWGCIGGIFIILAIIISDK